MSGTTPQKDQLVHNNLAHKLLFWGTSNPGQIALNPSTGHLYEVISDPLVDDVCLVEVKPEGFSITVDGALFIKNSLPDDVLSHRERKIMKDMTRPPQTIKYSLGTPVDPAMVNPDPSLSLAGLF